MSVRELSSGATDLPLDASVILNAMPHPVIAVTENMRIEYVNDAAEQFFDASRAVLLRHPLTEIVSFGSPLLALVTQVFTHRASVNEYGVELASQRFGERSVDIQVSPVCLLMKSRTPYQVFEGRPNCWSRWQMKMTVFSRN